jgi:hypothetical protein
MSSQCTRTEDRAYVRLSGKFLAWLVFALLAIFAAGAGKAQSLFEQLVMPGPVIEGHAKVETTCAKCHEAYSRQSQPKLCLECHKDIASDRQRERGFHGRDQNALQRDCKHCHTDHKGRTADIVRLDRETFNHVLTNFQLNGAHKSAPCAGCHKASEAFRKAPGRCIDCHKGAEPHKGRLGELCQNCHSEDGWRKTKPFDHDKTRFALVGAHKTVACGACHAGERYKDIATTCVGCHAQQDKHAGRYGQKCETCHASTKWATISFNHDKATKFPLRGKHATVKCDTCHAGDLYRDKLATNCASCHGKNDPHKGQLGARCEQCHKETGWRQKVAFDHDVTRFPLIGLHAAVACEECHRTTRFKDAPTACSGCHKDKFHEGRLGAQCAGCHNPNGWKRWQFDHARQTRFALDGAHKGLHCHACHQTKNVAKVTQSSGCYGCHSADDAHRGSFGRNCEQCHSTTSFRQRVQRR